MSRKVVPLFGRSMPSPAVAQPPKSHLAVVEKYRRTQVAGDISRLLLENSRDGVVFRLVEDPEGLRVDAEIGGHVRTVAGPRRESDVDNLYGIVRSCIGSWRQTLGRRAVFRVVH